MKTCTKCRLPQSGDCFYKKATTKDGLQPWCKGCFREASTERDCETEDCGTRFTGTNRFCTSCRATDRVCEGCGTRFTDTNRFCKQCRSTDRGCVGCGRRFRGTARFCSSCRATDRACEKCGRRFKGTKLLCDPCRRPDYRADPVARGALYSSRTLSLFELGERDGWICHLCSGAVPKDRIGTTGYHPLDPQADHLVPVSLAGPDADWNLGLAHAICNLTRGDLHLEDWVVECVDRGWNIGDEVESWLARSGSAMNLATVGVHEDAAEQGAGDNGL